MRPKYHIVLTILIFSTIFPPVCLLSSEEKPDNQLLIEFKSSETWGFATIESDSDELLEKSPEKLSIFIAGTTEIGKLKINLLFRDSEGDVFYSRPRSSLRNAPLKGKTMGYSLYKPKSSLRIFKSKGKKDPILPLCFLGFEIWNREKCGLVEIVMDNIKLDGKQVEDFDSDRNWKVGQTKAGVECKVEVGPAK